MTWLDWILILLLIVFFYFGTRDGMWVSVGRMLGIIGGVVLGLVLMPLIVALIPNPGWRVFAMISITVLLVILGVLIGLAIGAWIRLRVNAPAARRVDKVLGGFFNAGIAAILISLISFSITSMGVPGITATLKNSRVIAFVTGLTPEPARRVVAETRAWVVELNAPETSDAPANSENRRRTAESLDEVPEPSDEILAVRESTVRITGAAFECGQNQTGTGFAIAEDKVITNAHVVAGVDTPQVEVSSGEIYDGSVVYFDDARDLALVSLDDTTELSPIDTGDDLSTGDYSYALGFPAGGPFVASPGVVQAVGPASIANIYDTDSQLRNIYQLKSDIRQGNSGGPLVDAHGELVGVVFAKSQSAEVGYAMTLEEVSDLVKQADSLDEPVPSGQCIP